jgi:hypothetical protein
LMIRFGRGSPSRLPRACVFGTVSEAVVSQARTRPPFHGTCYSWP